MKTSILFSSIFYLIGLTVGSTIENVKNSLIPSRSIIAVPSKKTEKPEKSFQMKAKDFENKDSETDTVTEGKSTRLAAPKDTLTNRQV